MALAKNKINKSCKIGERYKYKMTVISSVLKMMRPNVMKYNKNHLMYYKN